MSASKRKGTAAETEVVRFLRTHGFPTVERRALNGASDRGDIAGIPGVVIEVKNHAALHLAEWVDEATVETENADADFGVVWHKRRGHSSAGNWYVTMDGVAFAELLFAAMVATSRPAGDAA